MGKIYGGGYIFVTWIGDHLPRHVHVYKNGTMITKWDLENSCEMAGKATRRIKKLIAELIKEKKL